MRIPFNIPHVRERELEYARQAIDSLHLSGDGAFTKKCHAWLEANTGAKRALLTHSCTAALEMMALLLDVKPGDEIVMPSFTFVSTANAFALRGAVPVFVDVRDDCFNLDERLLDAAIGPRTRAVCVVHYAGVGCEMDAIAKLCAARGVTLLEDAAQGAMSTYRGRALGTFGAFGALSFHETKNLISGEGGALLVNDDRHVARAEILREKGTNRSAFFRGEVDKYTWVDVGSSYLPGDMIAAFLWAQLEEATSITGARMALWARYHEAFADLERRGDLRRPIIPEGRVHNAHMYYLVMPTLDARTRLIGRLKASGIHAVFHYVPLHSSPAGRRLGRTSGDLPVTDRAASCLVRLPLSASLSPAQVDEVVAAVHAALA